MEAMGGKLIRNGSINLRELGGTVFGGESASSVFFFLSIEIRLGTQCIVPL